MRHFIIACTFFLPLATSPMLYADSFHLKSGGVVEGDLLNPKEESPANYLVRLAGGGKIALPADAVEKIETRSLAQSQYEAILPRMPATLEGNIKMADWCDKNGLKTLRSKHLEAVLEFDPNHEQARHALGYSQVRGRWVLTEVYRRENGEVRYKGRWYYKQDVALEMMREQSKLAAVEWRKKISLWRNWLDGRRRDEALAMFKSIDDWRAAPLIAEALKKERNQAVREMYVHILGKLPGDASAQTLMQLAIEDPVANTRELAIDKLNDRKQASSLGKFLRQRLQDKNPAVINQTALVLARIGDKDSIPALIDALISTVTIKGGGGGDISTSFGNGGTGFGAGKKPDKKQLVQNATVLAALRGMTRVDYGYNQAAWKKWYEVDQTPTNVDLRRGIP